MSDDLNKNYAKGGFNNHLKAGTSPALIIIDFVQAYLDPQSPLFADVTDAFASTQRLAKQARAQKIPVIFTTVEYDEKGLLGGIFFQKVSALECFVKGHPLGAFAPDLSPHDEDICITKQYASSFFGTSLQSTLTALGIDSLIITGVSTSGCVRATAVDALQHGFIPIVCRDAVGDRHDGPHKANLFDLQAKYAEVWSEQRVSDYMGSR